MTTKTYTIKEISVLDKEVRKLVIGYSALQVKAKMEIAQRLKVIKDNKLYSKLDEDSYPNFARYIESLNLNYKTTMEMIGLYETYVLEAGMSIDDLVEIGYHKLTRLKPKLFEKGEEGYKLTSSKTELKKWLSDAKQLTNEDFVQKITEDKAGKHEHDFETICFRKCRICKLREIIDIKNVKERTQD